MEPPAVTSCSVSHVSGLVGGSQHVNKRDMPVEFLQIEPQLNFNNASRHFEDLPENFLETISPQQGSGQSSSLSINLGGGHHVVNSQLASLTGMGVSGGDGGGYATLVSMPTQQHYVSALKMEAMEHLSHNSQLHSNIDKSNYSFGNGPAGLLSPLQLDSGNRDQNLGMIGVHRSNGRTSEMLSGIRRPEEIGSNDMNFQGAQDYDSGFSLQQPSQQELERMANAETPPALSNIEIASSNLGSLTDDSPNSPNHQDANNHFAVHHMTQQQLQHQMVSQQQHRHQQQQQQQQQHQNRQNMMSIVKNSLAKVKPDPGSIENIKGLDFPSTSQDGNGSTQQVRFGIGPMGPGAGIPRATYSTSDMTDPLNAEIDDDIYIDTKDLCKRVAYELKQHSIPQAIFAERILCRSQGTLSDLLRNPKPWNRLKSGRETFRRMFNWLQQPLHIRLSILDMYKGPMGTSAIAPPTPAQNARHHTRSNFTSNTNENGHPHPKRPRLVFTDIQKRTLQAIFKETQRPSREMQQTIAEHLCLDMSTVSNFFMNARRRSRNGSSNGDEPAPYQQVRQITPPPDSPPQRVYTSSGVANIINEGIQNNRNRQSFKSNYNLFSNHSHHQNSNHLQHDQEILLHQQAHDMALHHIEETVDEVVERSAAYSQFHSESSSPDLTRDQGSLWNNDDNDENMLEEQDLLLPSTKQINLMSGSSDTRNIAVSSSKTITVKVEHHSGQNQSESFFNNNFTENLNQSKNDCNDNQNVVEENINQENNYNDEVVKSDNLTDKKQCLNDDDFQDKTVSSETALKDYKNKKVEEEAKIPNETHSLIEKNKNCNDNEDQVNDEKLEKIKE